MVKKKQQRGLTPEQRKRIMEEPGVIVHRGKRPPRDPFFEPKFRVRLPITASELINDEDDGWAEE